jgi:1-phosphofructokinase family hexose kinase
VVAWHGGRVIVCVAPNPSIDKLFVAERVVPGAIHRPQRLVVRAGGKALNVARAAHTLGADVCAVALLAGHAGRWVADELRRAGVPCAAAWGEGETRTSLSVAADGAMTEFYERGDPPGAAAWAAFVAQVAGAAAADGTRALSISGSMPPGVAAEEAAALVLAGRRAGVPVAVDQHGPTLEAALAGGPDIVKVNRHEAAQLAGVDDPAAAAAMLRDRLAAAGAPDPTAIVTLGEDGALALTADGTLLRGTLEARGPYPTGSGDAFLAGLLVARGDGASWADALAAGLGAGSANAEAEGAGTLDGGRARTLSARARIAATAA